MKLNEYQKKAKEFAVYPNSVKEIYPIIGLANEAGETLGKLKKYLRGDAITQSEFRNTLKGELGDVLWYLAISCEEHGLDLEDIMYKNLEKLESRKERGVIKGNGDNR